MRPAAHGRGPGSDDEAPRRDSGPSCAALALCSPLCWFFCVHFPARETWSRPGRTLSRQATKAQGYRLGHCTPGTLRSPASSCPAPAASDLERHEETKIYALDLPMAIWEGRTLCPRAPDQTLLHHPTGLGPQPSLHVTQDSTP